MGLFNHIVIGQFLIICGIVIGFVWPTVLQYILKEKLALRPSSDSYKLWVKTPIPMYLEVYLFNWTNSEEFLQNKKIKPEFEEIGPFVFREVHQRVDIKWTKNNSIIYNQTRTWSFVPEESLNLSTPITNLNVIATTVAKMASGYNRYIVKVVLEFLNYVYKEKLLIAKPAREWLFDGMNDKLLDFIQKFMDVPYNKFGWFYGRNLSAAYDGRFNINTGQDDIFRLGEMEEWNYANKTGYYEGECGVVKGSSGELFAPLRNNQNELSIFVTDFCGPLTLKYSGLKSIEGLDGYHYVGDESVFDNGTINPRDKCFCTGECPPRGVRNVTSCRRAPLFISFPHFYLADPSYAEAVTGMSPNKTEHEFYLSIDRYAGIPLEVRAQLQLNVLLRPLSGFHMFVDVPNVYVPMMWFRQRARVTPELASKGKSLRLFEQLGLSIAWVLGVVGLLNIVLGICFFIFSLRRRRRFERLITPNETKEDEPQTSESESE